MPEGMNRLREQHQAERRAVADAEADHIEIAHLEDVRRDISLTNVAQQIRH
jgi:hypothetical protein